MDQTFLNLASRLGIEPVFSPLRLGAPSAEALREERDTLRETGAPAHIVRAATALTYSAEFAEEEGPWAHVAPGCCPRALGWAEYGHAVLDAGLAGAPWPEVGQFVR